MTPGNSEMLESGSPVVVHWYQVNSEYHDKEKDNFNSWSNQAMIDLWTLRILLGY